MHIKLLLGRFHEFFHQKFFNKSSVLTHLWDMAIVQENIAETTENPAASWVKFVEPVFSILHVKKEASK